MSWTKIFYWLPLVASILAFYLGWYFGSRIKLRKLESDLRHTEVDRNELHVQSETLREMVDNQELDIKRYVAELQLYVTMHKEWQAEREHMQIALQQNFPAKSDPSSESQALMVKILKQEIAETKTEHEHLLEQIVAQEQLNEAIKQEHKSLRDELVGSHTEHSVLREELQNHAILLEDVKQQRASLRAAFQSQEAELVNIKKEAESLKASVITQEQVMNFLARENQRLRSAGSVQVSSPKSAPAPSVSAEILTASTAKSNGSKAKKNGSTHAHANGHDA